MKKMYALLLAVMLIVSMTACTKGGGDVKADLDKIQQASTKSTEQNALDAKVSMTMKMDADGETMEIPITMDHEDEGSRYRPSDVHYHEYGGRGRVHRHCIL